MSERAARDGDESVEFQYRVVRRPAGRDDAEWQNVITARGLGRPFTSLPAAKGLITRELGNAWNRNYEYTFQTPGDVCLGCSDPDAGRWVAASECETALAIFELQRAELDQLYEEGLRALEARDA